VAENRCELLELWLGCAWLGAISRPVNTALHDAQLELRLPELGDQWVSPACLIGSGA
jgi:acyl-CoA synthetase (AMP-forming)/AMP-acid ligase II